MSEQDIEYVLTEKGNELSKELSNKNIQKNELMETIVDQQVNYKGNSEDIKSNIQKLKSLDKQIKQLEEQKQKETKKMSYQNAEKIRKKSFGTLLGEQEGGLGESLKKVISLKMMAKVTGIKESFDPLNIAKFFGGKTGAAILGKLTGRSREDIARYTGGTIRSKETATKLSPMEKDSVGQSGGMVDILTKILTLLQTSNESTKIRQEELKGLIEEQELEKNKKFEKFLAALKALRGGGVVEIGTEEGMDSSGGPGIIPIGGAKPRSGAKPGGAKPKGGKASKITQRTDKNGRVYYADEKGKRVSTEKGKSATKVGKNLKAAKSLLSFLKKIPLVSTLASAATFMVDIADAISQNEAGEIDDNELKRRVVKAIGGAVGGIGGAELGAILGGTVGSIVPGAGTFLGSVAGGVAGFMAGQQGGEWAAEKLFDYAAENDVNIVPKFLTAEKVQSVGEIQYDDMGNPTGMSAPSEPEPVTPTPNKPQSNFGKSQRTVAAQKSSAAIPMASTSAGDKLNQVVSENNEVKLPAKETGSSTVVNKNTVASSSSSSESRNPILSVRNNEETFRRLVSESIRVV